MLRIILLAAILASLTGCATKPPTSSFSGALHESERIDPLSVAALARPLKVTPSSGLSTSLEASNRVVAYDMFHSFYRTVEVEAENHGEVAVTVTSFCSCFGFDKRVVIPILLAFDTVGRYLQIDGIRYEVMKASGITPLRIVLSGQIQTSGAKIFRLLLLADNSLPDSPVKKILLVDQFGISIMNLQVLSYPVGDMALAVSTSER